MGYLENQALITILFSLGIAITTTVVIYLIAYFYRENKDKWKVKISTNPFIVNQRDELTKWVDTVDKRLKKSGIKARTKIIVIINILIAVIAFIFSLKLFQNIIAAIFFAIIFFIIPEYVLFLYEAKRKMKIEDQMVAAIRIFTAEYFNTKNIEKSFAEVSTKVIDPIGGYFADSYMDILMGHSFDNVMSKLSSRVDNEYWHMFVQLIFQLRDDSQAIFLFTDLVSRIEKSIELSRDNETSLGGERIVALVMALLPLPVYYFMASIVPQTTIFIVETVTGRIVITGSFISIFIFIFLDKMLRKVE